MSHISKIELEVKDLSVLASACRRLGLELMQGQTTYKWYGSQNKCEHAIKIPKATYEIGVIKKNGLYELECDYFDEAVGKAVGQNAGLLKQAYAVEKARLEARRKGYSVTEQKTEAGIRLLIRLN